MADSGRKRANTPAPSKRKKWEDGSVGAPAYKPSTKRTSGNRSEVGKKPAYDARKELRDVSLSPPRTNAVLPNYTGKSKTGPPVWKKGYGGGSVSRWDT